uniref:Uncharacterized protein n=1 Tax=Panagrolaimus sp. PS1159 TaxID=55785 RepID=A0AC35F8A0_9BILA
MIFSFNKITTVFVIIALSLISFNNVKADDNDERFRNYAINSLSSIATKAGQLDSNVGAYQGSYSSANNEDAYYPKFPYSKYMHPPPPPPGGPHGTDDMKPRDPQAEKGRNSRDPDYEDYYENKIKNLKHQS